MTQRRLNLTLTQLRAPSQADVRAISGVETATIEDRKLKIAYELRATTCAQIMQDLQRLGIEIELSRFEQWRLAFRAYREGIVREDFNNEIGWDSFVREIYVSRYRHRRHGRRDDRPRHWRQYLLKNDLE